MAELLPENLGHLSSDEDHQVFKPKRRMVSDIVEWLQCYGTYIAIISWKQPARVINLLGYQNFIIQAPFSATGSCHSHKVGTSHSNIVEPCILRPSWLVHHAAATALAHLVVLVIVKSCLTHKGSTHPAGSSRQTTSYHISRNLSVTISLVKIRFFHLGCQQPLRLYAIATMKVLNRA